MWLLRCTTVCWRCCHSNGWSYSLQLINCIFSLETWSWQRPTSVELSSHVTLWQRGRETESAPSRSMSRLWTKCSFVYENGLLGAPECSHIEFTIIINFGAVTWRKSIMWFIESDVITLTFSRSLSFPSLPLRCKVAKFGNQKTGTYFGACAEKSNHAPFFDHTH